MKVISILHALIAVIGVSALSAQDPEQEMTLRSLRNYKYPAEWQRSSWKSYLPNWTGYGEDYFKPVPPLRVPTEKEQVRVMAKEMLMQEDVLAAEKARNRALEKFERIPRTNSADRTAAFAEYQKASDKYDAIRREKFDLNEMERAERELYKRKY